MVGLDVIGAPEVELDMVAAEEEGEGEVEGGGKDIASLGLFGLLNAM